MCKDYKGVYVHTPFCLQKCLYCDFPSYAGYDERVREEYVQALCREIRAKAAPGSQAYQEQQGLAMPCLAQQQLAVDPQATIYFGGGTPTVLTAEQIGRIVAALKETGYWQAPAEATIEVNPGTADLAKLKALRELGFDRISFGVQSLTDRELTTIGRIHNGSQALQAVYMAQQAGFKRINADVMTGLPGQDLASLKDTLEQLVALGLQHLSVYSLILEENTPLEGMVKSGRLQLPLEEEALELYQVTEQFLEAVGLKRYEISNYARPGQESKHNLVYWHYEPYAAFGVGACAFNGRARFTNTRQVEAYLEAYGFAAAEAAAENTTNTTATLDLGGATAAEGSQPSPASIIEVEELTAQVQLEEYLFMGLRLAQGLDLQQAKARFGCEVWTEYGRELQPFLDKGMLVYDQAQGRLALTSKGFRYSNQIFEVFVKV